MNNLPMMIQAGGAAPAMVAAQGIHFMDRLVQAWTVSAQCRVAIRQLKVEELRITMEFKTHRARIKTEAKIRMEELRIERLQYEGRLDCIKESLRALLAQRSQLMEAIMRAQRDGQYEFAGRCLQMLSEVLREQNEGLKLLARPSAHERNLIGG
jgi:DNA anti-recombination protein RmuC